MPWKGLKVFRNAVRTVAAFCCLLLGWWQVVADEFDELPRPVQSSVEKLPDTAADSSSSASALNVILGESVLSGNVLHVCATAAELGDRERLKYLLRWVLPTDKHGEIRCSGQFGPTNLNFNFHTGSGSRGDVQSHLISPVFDLVDTAKKLGQLEDLRQRVAGTNVADERQQRAKQSLLVMIDLQRGDVDAASDALDELQKLTHDSVPQSMFDQWPETLAACYAVNRFPKFEVVIGLLEFLQAERAHKNFPKNCSLLHTHFVSLLGRALVNQTRSEQAVTEDQFTDWIATERQNASSHGTGFPNSMWQWDQGGGLHFSGHEDDYLFFRQPLRGSFEVEADLTALGRTQLMFAGGYIGPTSKGMFEGTIRKGLKEVSFEPPPARLEKWARIRAVFDDDNCRVYLNGRYIKTLTGVQQTSPWIGLRNWSRSHGTFQDVRISGTPVIPDSVQMINSTLEGWVPYYSESIGYRNAAWEYQETADGVGEILGRRFPPFVGTFNESLLRYIVPLSNEGAVEYDFFYETGQSNVGPTIGDLTFLLEPDGVRLHQITDGRFDRSSRSPTASIPLTQRSAAGLPLRDGMWNRVRMMVAGRSLRLELNGREVCEHELDDSSTRYFGLFHFSDRHEVRVRNVVMSGDWPKELPIVTRQQFADHEPSDIAAGRPAFVFHHDFAADDFNEQFLSLRPGQEGQFNETERGFVQAVTSSGKWSQSAVLVNFQMIGDFDADAAFEDLVVTDHQSNGCGVTVTMSNGYRIELNRRRQNGNQHRVNVGWLEPAGDGEFRISYDNFATEAKAGRFRISRRGDHFTLMFAEHDSEQFRIVGSRTIPDSHQQSAEFRFNTVANLGGATSVTWKSLNLSAEELWSTPDPRVTPPSVLFVMNADGSELRQLTEESPDGNNQGSPDWSPDGQQIAFDRWTGRAETTHMFLINADGTDEVDLGIGTMPTFSPNGKRLAFTWSLNGMTTMNTAGTDRQVLTEDGWGAQWSPDGKWVAYTSYQRVNGATQRNITIIDVQTKEKRELLNGDDAARYRQIYWNMEWSPDSRQICFKGDFAGGTEVGIASITGAPVRVLTNANMYSDFSWHPNGGTILMSGLVNVLGGADGIDRQSMKGHRLYEYDLTSEEFRLLVGQPMNQDNTGMAWSPDGKRIAFVSHRLPGPVKWNVKHSD